MSHGLVSLLDCVLCISVRGMASNRKFKENLNHGSKYFFSLSVFCHELKLGLCSNRQRDFTVFLVL